MDMEMRSTHLTYSTKRELTDEECRGLHEKMSFLKKKTNNKMTNFGLLHMIAT